MLGYLRIPGDGKRRRFGDFIDGRQMHLTAVIPTLGREDLINRTVETLLAQSRLPEEIIVSAPRGCDLRELNTRTTNIRYLYGPAGLTAQRNTALDATRDCTDIITFFDDDFLPCRDYLQRVENAFQRQADWVVITGAVYRDGVSNAGLSLAEGLKELAAAENLARVDRGRDCVAAYGCNMSIRADRIGSLRFDERLPLYGWQEDVDFTIQMRRHGRIVRLESLIGVHLGHKAGRVSGVKFGYSQIANPVYLMRKGTMPRARGLSLMARNFAANGIRSIKPESYVDRRGRLKGNIVGILHHLQGRLDPEHILRL